MARCWRQSRMMRVRTASATWRAGLTIATSNPLAGPVIASFPAAAPGGKLTCNGLHWKDCAGDRRGQRDRPGSEPGFAEKRVLGGADRPAAIGTGKDRGGGGGRRRQDGGGAGRHR